MSCEKRNTSLQVSSTTLLCPIGETTGRRAVEESKIPVLSCEGACIRGEIARQAANLVAKQAGYGRGCHGELFTAPDSEIAKWVASAGRVVCIDGCFLRCHGRILENMIEVNRLIQFDALGIYKKYNNIFDADDVPESERLETARQVARHVIDALQRGDPSPAERAETSACCGS